MRSSRRSCLALLALTSVALLAPRPAAAENDTYTITDLGMLHGKTSATVYGLHSVNNAGQVVGHNNQGDLMTGLNGDYFSENVAFFWTKPDGIQALPPVPGLPNTSGHSLNDRGQVIGLAGNSYLDLRGILWDGASTQILAPRDGDMFTTPWAINNRGQIVGISGMSVASNFTSIHPVLWEKDPNGQIRTKTLPTDGFAQGQASDINEKGQIVGIVGTKADDFDWKPVLWDKGTITYLGSLGGGFGFAFANNEKGQIVGLSQAMDGLPHCFLWQDGAMTDLGSLGGVFASLWDINNHGQAVGEALDADFVSHAILAENQELIDLNDRIPADSGWFLTSASGINERGQIAGFGIRGGEIRSFLLTPRKH